MQQDRNLRSFINTALPHAVHAQLVSAHPTVKEGSTWSTASCDTEARIPSAGALLHANAVTQQCGSTATMAADPAGSGPAAKRPRVEDVLQQTAPREQLLISELMGWRGSSNQDSMSLLGGVSTGVTATTGFTDFRALFARQGSQQPSGGARVVASAATTGLRTFADVASRPAVGPEDVGRQDVLGIMRAAYNSASLADPSRTASQHTWATHSTAGPLPGATGGAATAATGGDSAAPEELTPEALPVDWGIKRGVHFSSRSSFGLHDRALRAPPGARWRAAQAAINCDLEACGGDEVVRYLASQVSWRHPDLTLDPSTLAAAARASTHTSTSAAAGPAASSGGLIAQRLAAWRGALYSLYGMYRSGDCHLFYIINSAPRNPYVALFAGRGIRGCQEMSALVSQSSRALRGRLLAAGVRFSMPLERPAGAAVGAVGGGGKGGQEAAGPNEAEEAADEELCDQPNTRVGPSATPLVGAGVVDNSRESLLLLRGPRAVHGLYDFLLNETSYGGHGARAGGGGGAPGGGGDDLVDLPLLLAPTPFEGGSVWRPAVKAVTMSSKVAGGGFEAGSAIGGWSGPAATNEPAQDPAGLVHVLQVAGPLPPWTVRRMCTTLAQLHPAGFTATLDPEPTSIPLNSRVLETGGGGEGEGGGGGGVKQPPQRQFVSVCGSGGGGGALTAEELEAWRQPVVLPGGRPVRGVTCGEGTRRLTLRV